MSFELLREYKAQIEDAETIEELFDVFVDAVEDLPYVSFGWRVQRKLILLIKKRDLFAEGADDVLQ